MSKAPEKLTEILDLGLKKMRVHKAQRYEIRVTEGGVARPTGTPLVKEGDLGVCVAIGAGSKNPAEVPGSSGIYFVMGPDGEILRENYHVGPKLSEYSERFPTLVKSVSRQMAHWYQTQNV